MRTDLIINAMVSSGLQNGSISIKNEFSMRSILGISDLANAVKSILSECPANGIYNVASESATIGEIGQRIAGVLGVPVKFAPSDGTYNFQVSTRKLEKHTSWRSTETIESLVADLRVGLAK
jgi:nucleoside-diphosphate-sugar epimerase